MIPNEAEEMGKQEIAPAPTNHFATIVIREYGRGEQNQAGERPLDKVYRRNVEPDEEIPLFQAVNRRTGRRIGKPGARARLIGKTQPLVSIEAQKPVMFISENNELRIQRVTLTRGESVNVRPFSPSGWLSPIPDARITHLRQPDIERPVTTSSPAEEAPPANPPLSAAEHPEE